MKNNFDPYQELYSCPVCKEHSCGIDEHTRTKYQTEKSAGDRMKVILLQLNDLIDIDNLQIYELKALVNSLIDEHFTEEEV